MPLTKEKLKHFQEKLEEEKTAGKASFLEEEKSGSIGRLGSRSSRFECGNIGHGRIIGRF